MLWYVGMYTTEPLDGNIWPVMKVELSCIPLNLEPQIVLNWYTSL